MLIKSYARGLILWIDDNLHNQAFPGDLWASLFGDYSDRVLRLMDLSIEVAGSYKEGVEIIKSFDLHKEAGTFVYCIVDLNIPPENGFPPALRYGVALAKELQKRDVPFAFLSANTGGAAVVGEEHLSAIPYYVKEQGSVWKFPDALALKVTSEIRRHISWVSIEEVVAAMHPGSDISSTFRLQPDTFRYFPFFGPFREYVERCEYRASSDLPKTVAVRSARSHCDEFVQQAMAIMLYQTLLRHQERVKVIYGHAHLQAFQDRLQQINLQNDVDSITIIRLDPRYTTVADLSDLIGFAGRSAGRTIFVLPNDESVDEFTEYLRVYQITDIEELPQTRSGDSLQREELLRQSCALAFQHWVREQITTRSIFLREESFTYPEFLINPIDWTALLETYEVAEALSDPYEIVLELNTALQEVTDQHKQAILNTFETGEPLSYVHLLKVGRRTLLASEFKDNLFNWIERTFDNWLRTSRQSPYGILERQVKSSRFDQDPESTDPSAIINDAWQDICYEVLVEIIEEYKHYRTPGLPLTQKQRRLQRVIQFVDTLGGHKFIQSDIDDIAWSDLATIRWPHRYYPMPSAIIRRLREAKRYLWIQPEGLDMALTLPAGRLRYRVLSSTINQYSSVLDWAQKITPDLPLGWQYSIGYLTDVIMSVQIETAWLEEPDRVWNALLGLLRNGGPIMFITDQILQGKSINRGSDSIKSALSDIHGYGVILNRLREVRARRVSKYLCPRFDDTLAISDITWLRHFDGLLTQLFEDDENHLTELETALVKLVRIIGSSSEAAIDESDQCENVMTAEIFADYLADSALRMTKADGWFIANLDQIAPQYASFGELPSLFGTKIDHLWHLIDLLIRLDNITRRYRYYDGYHLLSSIHDLRLQNKDSRPEVPVAAIETILDLFISSLEGLLAQLAWCVELTGNEDLATSISPEMVKITPPASFKPPSPKTLSSVLDVRRTDDHWEVFTLGIPGKSTVDKLCYHDRDSVRKI